MSIGLLYMQRNETQIHIYTHAFEYTFSSAFAWIQILTHIRTFTQARTHTSAPVQTTLVHPEEVLSNYHDLLFRSG
jgi:hypothetical protein